MAGPMQLGHRPDDDKLGAQPFPAFERIVAEQRAGIVTPTQHREPWPEYVVKQNVLRVASVDAGLDEQRAHR